MRFYRFLIILLCLALTAGHVHAKVMPVEFDTDRNRLIAYILGHQLPSQHFSHKEMDNDLSRAAYDLYLQQLDPRKRFFLKQDIEKLNIFAEYIDDELLQGNIVLPDTAAALFNQRVEEIRVMVEQLMEAGFDFNAEEYLEVDPEKRDFAATESDLRDRWRRTLKMQILSTYFDLQEKEQQETEPKKADATTDNGQTTNNAATKLNKDLLDKAMEKTRKDNFHYLNRLLKEHRQQHYDRYFEAVAQAFDPHTGYMAPTSKEDFDIHMRGSLEGIGAMLREDDGHIKVVRIIPGSAAERQGQLQAEDIILSVGEKVGDFVDITDMRLREAVSYIRGPKGTEVLLIVQKPDGARKTIAIVRDVVQIEEAYVKSTVLAGSQENKIGYIRIPSFYRDFAGERNGEDSRNVTDDMIKELNRLKDENIQGLILDMRNNGGGSLADAVEISGLFLSGGPVVQVKNSQGMIRVLEDENHGVAYDGPLVVLVNKFSASASEIVAAALQDYGRALIIGGEHTHGKGTVQALFDMNRNLPLFRLKKYEDLGTLKVTIQKFYRVTGGSTQYRGITPDIVVPSILEYLETGEQYLDYSLPWDHVDSLDYKWWKGPHFNIPEVKKRCNDWIKASDEFQKIQKNTALAIKRRERTLLPVFAGGMEKMRREFDSADIEQNELESAGSHAANEDEKKSLKEQVAEDPYIKITLFLMEETTRTHGNFGGTK